VTLYEVSAGHVDIALLDRVVVWHMLSGAYQGDAPNCHVWYFKGSGQQMPQFIDELVS